MLDFLPVGTSEFHYEEAQLGSGTQVMVAIPKGEIKFGLVLVPDVFGLRPLITETISQIASNSIAVIAVEPFSHMSENPTLLSRKEKLSRVKDLDDQMQCADILAAGKILRSRHGCEKVSLIGFCIGGMYAFKSAGAGEFDAVVACYGMITMPNDWRGPGQKDALEYLELDSCSKVLAIVGEKDKGFAKPDDIESLQRVLSNPHHEKIGSRVDIYSEGEHAFIHDPERPEHRAQDAEIAWGKAFDFMF